MSEDALAPRRRAVVVGGGVAGLTAAFGLADRGFAVELLESRQQVGGRAFSSADAVFGRRLDNGPHAMLGCYRATLALLRRLGTEDRCERAASLTMAYRGAGGSVRRLQLSRLPVPLAMPWALFGLCSSWRARARALAGMAAALLPTPAAWSLADWLDRRRQRGEPDDLLWRPLCRAIMNVEPEDASARDFVRTLREAFSGRASSAAFVLPRGGWSELLGDAAPAALERAGITLRTGARVERLVHEGRRVRALQLGDGTRVDTDGSVVVLAVPWFVFGKLIEDAATALLPASLRSSPIVTAYGRTAPDAPSLPDDGPVVVLVDGDPFHFVLRTPGDGPQWFAMLSGGAPGLDGIGVDAIAARAKDQLQRHYPGFDTSRLDVRIRREQHATFVADVGSERRRPRPGRVQGWDGVFVCGDWTATGLPATLEGAARSAEVMLGEVGRSKNFRDGCIDGRVLRG